MKESGAEHPAYGSTGSEVFLERPEQAGKKTLPEQDVVQGRAPMEWLSVGNGHAELLKVVAVAAGPTPDSEISVLLPNK
jgi:hypothetical protein